MSESDSKQEIIPLETLEKTQPRVKSRPMSFAIGRPPKQDAVSKIIESREEPVESLASVPPELPSKRKVASAFAIGRLPKNKDGGPASVIEPPAQLVEPVKKVVKRRRKVGAQFVIGQQSVVDDLKKDIQKSNLLPSPPAVKIPEPVLSPIVMPTELPSAPVALAQIALVKRPASEVHGVKGGQEDLVAKQTVAQDPAEILGSGQPKVEEQFVDVLKPEKDLSRKLKQGNKQHRYLAQAVVLEESGLSVHIRLAMSFVAAVVIAFFVWASFSTVEEMAASAGQVMPSGPVQNIQHLEGGIVKQIFVKERDLVKEGQLLFLMAPESALAELNQMRSRRAALESQAARNQAFLDNKEPDFSQVADEFSYLIRDQTLLLAAQRSYRESRRNVLQSKIEQRQARITNLLAQKGTSERQLKLIGDEVSMRWAGVEQGVMSRLSAMSSERDRSRVAGELARIQGDLSTAKKELDEANKQLISLEDELRQAAMQELGGISAELSQLREGMLRQQNRVARLEVRAPVTGVIKNLQMETLRGVVPPGGHLTEIVPVEPTRWVETHITTQDVGHVKAGQKVTVKVSTFDFARYGGIDGVLESISATTFKDPGDPTPYYKGIIRLDHSYVGDDATHNSVLPGMSVQADIHTGSKTLMEYMLKPIYASVNKAFRER